MSTFVYLVVRISRALLVLIDSFRIYGSLMRMNFEGLTAQS